ncbi:hypothetical protein NOM74_09550 [Klebsiella quasipneumoniae]|uniref:hypothetical protein n=1 Tax=Klebsiella quasipneumoniae TaxID=1463165 RepID=UPI00217DE0A3|nr:hypothetical protein [Klebsiella quasipneumoniae]MCS6744882.1 hypothetical protein [Klebsiella quasipneumoniae]
MADDKPVWLLCPPFCRVAASPYPAYERQQYQMVMRLAVGPRKRSAAGQSLKIALWLQSECLPHREGILADDKPVSLSCPPFCLVAASPYPAYERQQYQMVMWLAVGPRKRSAAGQSLKIALWLQSE